MKPNDISDEDWLLARMSAPLMMAKIDETKLLNHFVSWYLSEYKALESEEYFEIDGFKYLPVLTVASFGATVDCCLYVQNKCLQVEVVG